MNDQQIPNAFAQLLFALEPWLDRLVIIGGWAHRLYRLHPDAQELDYPPLTTLDADLALPSALIAGEPDIRTRLLDFGFIEEFFVETRPPATHYRLGGEHAGFYAEFVTPLMGGEYDRRRRRKTTIQIGGASTQQLRHVEVLLHRPWSTEVEHAGFAGQVHIANPVAFLTQKILIHRRRERRDRVKDLLYMRDTLEVFGSRLPELASLWRSGVAEHLQHREAARVSTASRTMFDVVSDDIRRAAEISAERALDPEEIRQACQYGFTKIFGA
jgi:Nucleotidyltransferase